MDPSNTPLPFTVVFQSREAEHVEVVGDRVVLSVRLPRLYAFAQTHVARLALVSSGQTLATTASAEEPFFVFASFAEPQPFNAEFRPLLGTSQTASNSWVPLAGNLISSIVTLTLQTLSGAHFARSLPSGLTLIVCVAPVASSRALDSLSLHRLAPLTRQHPATATSTSPAPIPAKKAAQRRIASGSSSSSESEDLTGTLVRRGSLASAARRRK